MKNRKGFTLIELIVVMAIFSILMLALTKFSKPVCDLADEAIKFDAKGSVCNEMNWYVIHSIKYSDAVNCYSNYKNLPDTAIQDFATSNGITADKIKVIAIINDFSVVKNSVVTNITVPVYDGKMANNDCGRIFKTKQIDSSYIANYYMAMGKWFYGKDKYMFDVAFNNNIISIKVTDSGGLTRKLESSLLNYDASKFKYYSLSSGTSEYGKNTYIIYMA